MHKLATYPRRKHTVSPASVAKVGRLGLGMEGARAMTYSSVADALPEDGVVAAPLLYLVVPGGKRRREDGAREKERESESGRVMHLVCGGKKCDVGDRFPVLMGCVSSSLCWRCGSGIADEMGSQSVVWRPTLHVYILEPASRLCS